MNLFKMDATTLRSILRAYYEIFPYGFALANRPSGDLLLLGSERPRVLVPETIAARMRAPRVRQPLARAKLHRPADLLWYFALSRAEALEAAGDAPPNTDTNILSEVRLARLPVDLDEEQSPYSLLEKHFGFDVGPYLDPRRAGAIVFDAGRYFIGRASLVRTDKAIAQLLALDPARAERLMGMRQRWRDKVRATTRQRNKE